MSLTKSYSNFDRLMEEQRRDLDNFHTEYLESVYLEGRKQRFPADDEVPETTATEVAQTPKR